MFSSGN